MFKLGLVGYILICSIILWKNDETNLGSFKESNLTGVLLIVFMLPFLLPVFFIVLIATLLGFIGGKLVS